MRITTGWNGRILGACSSASASHSRRQLSLPPDEAGGISPGEFAATVKQSVNLRHFGWHFLILLGFGEFFGVKRFLLGP